MTIRQLKLHKIKIAAATNDPRLTRYIIESHINREDCMAAMREGLQIKNQII